MTGAELPDGHRLESLRSRPDLEDALNAHNIGVWPTFMLEDPVADELWHHLVEDYPDYQLILLDADGRIAAACNSGPLWWDGTDDGLPDGWDDQMRRMAADVVGGRRPNTLGAVQIVVDPARQGSQLSGVMLGAMRAGARDAGYGAVIACVRPTWKERYPLVPLERYAAWVRDDGLPFDPWIRLHVRVGGRIVKPSPSSMTITGSVAHWEAWTGMAFPDSGAYVVPGAAAIVTIDREADHGTYHDPNVWIVHDLG